MGEDVRGVSVVVAVRDGERYLGEALESILGQSTPPGEVVVVDDGSTDATGAVLERFASRVRVVRQEPIGVAAALNRGIGASARELLAFLDADDVWPPRSLEARLVRLGAADRPDAVFGRLVQFLSPDVDPTDARTVRFDPSPAPAMMFQTMLIRRAAFKRVGPLATEYVIGANIDWVSRAQAISISTAQIDDVVAMRRIHTTNLGRTARERETVDLVRAVRAHRRRHLAT
jgi:glycosyltransferase involved in cell wall biosynthesis